MANNRMFLVHLPTGLAVGLGKRMTWGWYLSDKTRDNVGESLATLYAVLEKDHAYDGRQDDFSVALEDAHGATTGHAEWTYGAARDDGLVQLIFARTLSG